LTESYANNNFGHILIDDLYTVFHAMQHWGIGGYNSSRIVSIQQCIPVSFNYPENAIAFAELRI
jgi:hypothetical protein